MEIQRKYKEVKKQAKQNETIMIHLQMKDLDGDPWLRSVPNIIIESYKAQGWTVFIPPPTEVKTVAEKQEQKPVTRRKARTKKS